MRRGEDPPSGWFEEVFSRVRRWLAREGDQPEHLRRGNLGERAAKRYLKRAGLKFLTANFKSSRGEIDLVFRDGDCLLFVVLDVKIVLEAY